VKASKSPQLLLSKNTARKLAKSEEENSEARRVQRRRVVARMTYNSEEKRNPPIEESLKLAN
jgi:hypothetical protein